MEETNLSLRYFGTFKSEDGEIEVMPNRHDAQKVTVTQKHDGETQRKVISRDELVQIIEQGTRNPHIPHPPKTIRLSKEVFGGELGGPRP